MSKDIEKRMKELAERMVAMTPEPPPFPEEGLVTQPSEPKSNSRPVLIFAGAALLVLLLAAVPIFLLNSGAEVEPSDTTVPTTVPTTVTTLPATTVTSEPAPTTTTAPETTSTSVAPVEGGGLVIFLTQSPENSFTGNPAVVPFLHQSPDVSQDLPQYFALRILTDDTLTPPPGFDNMIPAEVEVNGAGGGPGDRQIVVDMNEAFLQGSGNGLLGDMTMLNQLIFTATSDVITEVLFTVNDQPVTAFGSEGLDLSEPVTRESFLDQLNPIIVDSAASVTGDSPLTMTGIANVFEATVNYQLVDESGEVVYEGHTMASCGTGCWGAFSFNIDDFDFSSSPVTLKVFTYSAENGEPVDVVSIPVGYGDQSAWNMLPGGS